MLGRMLQVPSRSLDVLHAPSCYRRLLCCAFLRLRELHAGADLSRAKLGCDPSPLTTRPAAAEVHCRGNREGREARPVEPLAGTTLMGSHQTDAGGPLLSSEPRYRA